MVKWKEQHINNTILVIGIIAASLLLVLVLILVVGMTQTNFISDSQATQSGEQIERSVLGLDIVQESEIIQIENGETFDLSADIIKKEINGNEIRMLGYNSQIPGPLLKVKQGEEISIDFTNNLDAETTVHWHGLRVDNAFDGVPDITQEAVKPGETFRYELKFPDPGIYWYHPHVREDYQQELGLYANIVVIPTVNDYNPVNREEVITLDDIQMLDLDVYPFYEEGINQALMGRFGNVMLINGKTNYQLTVDKGEVVRFYFTNVANARTFNIQIPGATMKLVGGDGGLYEKEEFVNSIVIAPSERYIVEILLENSGTYEIKNINPIKSYVLGTVTVTGQVTSEDYKADFELLKTKQSIRNIIPNFDSFVSKQPDVTLALAGGSQMAHGMMHVTTQGGIEWEDSNFDDNVRSTETNTKWFIIDTETEKKNMDIERQFTKGDYVKISLVNPIMHVPHPMQHPLHFHGNRFLILSQNNVQNDNLVWKDTVLVPSGSTIDILLEVSNPGEWMAHCHIAEHLSGGMMFEFKVTE